MMPIGRMAYIPNYEVAAAYESCTYRPVHGVIVANSISTCDELLDATLK